MADLRLKLKVNYNPTTEDSVSKLLEKIVTITGTEFTHSVQSIGLTEEAIEDSSDIATPGFCIFRNLDTTNYIEIGLTGSYPTKLKAGEFCVFRANGALFAIADTAACRLEYWVFED